MPDEKEFAWRRATLGKQEKNGTFSTTIRMRAERYRWLNQVSATSGRSKSDLVDQALNLLMENLGYGTRPAS